MPSHRLPAPSFGSPFWPRSTFAFFLGLLLMTAAISVRALADEAAAPAPLKKGDHFAGYELENQHGVKHQLAGDTELVLMSFDMELSKSVHAYLSEKDPNYLREHHVEYVVDITEMPGIISYLFAKPKMRKYPFDILLADDETFGPKFPKEDKKLLVIELAKDRTVKNIQFLDSMEAVDKEYFQKPKEDKVSVTNLATQKEALKK